MKILNSKKMIIALIMGLSIFTTACTKKEDFTVKEIIIDGGGDIGNFNTTPTMKLSDANPFPYNTLEVLVSEWMELNPEYNVTINTTSSGGDRAILVPQLNNRLAPDIAYQNGTVLFTDLGKGYYVKMNDYFEMPNPYVEGNTRWADLYSEEELNSTMAPDGGFYTTLLEKVPVGILYNIDLFKAAGITVDGTPNTDVLVPATFTEFLAAQAKIKELEGKEAYATTYTWYDIVIESNLFSHILEEADVLRPNGIVDTEELVRAYDKGIWNPTLNALGDNPTFEGNIYYEFIKLAKRKTEYYPDNWQSYDAHTNFVNGKLGMVEVTGAEIRKLSINSNIDFEWGVMPFPDLTLEDSPYVSKPVVRGTAGLATAWFITNSAMDKGTVEGCVDLLMFLTAPENNNRLIGDLKGGIPLNPDSNTEIAPYLQDLVDIYNSDIIEAQNGERVYWAAVNSWAVLGYSYNTTFIKTLQDIDNGVKTIEEATTYLANTISSTVRALELEYEYDKSTWDKD